jgi:hypothetical protein
VMAMNYRPPLLVRLIAVHIALFGVVAMTAAWAEDAAPGANHSDALTPGPRAGHGQGQSDEGGASTKTTGKSDLGAVGDAETRGSEKAKVDGNATGKLDSSIGNMGEHHAISKGRSNGEEQTDGKGVRHGEDFAGAKHSGTGFSPIDTRITVLGAPRFGRAPEARDRKKQEIARQSGTSADHRRTSTGATKDRVLRNAIGLRVHQTSTENKRTDVKVFERLIVERTPRSTSPAGTGGMTAVGSDVPRQGFVPLAAGGGKPPQPPINTAMKHSIIDGREMARPGSRSSVIGGAATNIAGGINGTNFRHRHP